MRTTEQLSITLPVEMASFVQQKVQHGQYASVSEVVREGLRALAERDAVVDQWLRDVVVPSYLTYRANPKGGVSIEQMHDAVTSWVDNANKTTKA